jgi:hypothetical protein
MGFDPISIGLMVGMGALAYGASQKKTPEPSVIAPPAVQPGGGVDVGKKVRKYRPAAQLFKNDDLRLGMAGKLGM